jgi:cytochrome c5
LTTRELIAAALLAAPFTAMLAAAQDEAPGAHSAQAGTESTDATSSLPDPGSTLPDAPAKGLVLAQCNICHGLAWIERSGADEAGWLDRIRRMIRAGAQIPPEQVPLMAAYLAKALPERPRPPEPEKHRRHSSSNNH